MQIQDEFRVNLPLEQAWLVLLDVERIAPCLPGAQLQEIEGDEYRGIVKVKVGPITAQYKGTAKIEVADVDARRVVIRASGRDTRGQGNASATVTLDMRADGEGTAITVDTDLSITGKVAQFGRGVLGDVSAKLLGQFVENLERDVLNGADVEMPVDPVVDLEDNGADPAIAKPAAAADAAEAKGGGVRQISSVEAEPVDLLAMGGQPVARRLGPLFAVAGVTLVMWRLMRRRSRCASRVHRSGKGAI